MFTVFSPLVSIITPTYNHERFIAQCIESVLAQSYSNWEQIIFDDGSTDNTAQIVARYQDSRIHYYRQENAGIEKLAQTYNRALSLCGGDLIAILEGDDFWPSTKLARMVPAFADEGVVLAYGQMRETDVAGEPAKRMSRTARIRNGLPARILRNDPPPSAAAYMLTVPGHSLIEASTVLLRRSSLDAIGGFHYVPDRRAVDFPTFIRLAVEGRFSYLPEILGYRRMHPTSTTAVCSTQMLRASQAFLHRLLNDRSFILTDYDRRRIERSWRHIERSNEFALGRLRLLDGRWKDARRHFAQAISFSAIRVSLGSVIGWCFSWLHCSMETIFHVAGRASMRLEKR